MCCDFRIILKHFFNLYIVLSRASMEGNDYDKNDFISINITYMYMCILIFEHEHTVITGTQ